MSCLSCFKGCGNTAQVIIEVIKQQRWVSSRFHSGLAKLFLKVSCIQKVKSLMYVYGVWRNDSLLSFPLRSTVNQCFLSVFSQ